MQSPKTNPVTGAGGGHQPVDPVRPDLRNGVMRGLNRGAAVFNGMMWLVAGTLFAVAAIFCAVHGLWEALVFVAGAAYCFWRAKRRLTA